MAKFKTAFVAITIFFCLFQNGGAQQYEDRLSQSVGDWQPRRSRLKSKPATRSVAPSPEEIPNYSSLDVTTRSRQRTRGRNIPDPQAVPRHDGLDAPENQQQQFLQDPSFRVDLPRGRNDDFRGSQQRTNIKTLEDSLNTERYQKRIERPQNSRRKDFADQIDASGPADFRRNEDAEVESFNRAQRTRSRVAAERRIGASNYVAGGEVQNRGFVEAPADVTAVPRSRGNFRGRVSFQDAPTANAQGEAPKRGRSRVLTSRHRNVDAPFAVEDAGGRVPAAELEAARTLLPGSTTQFAPPDQFPSVQQFSVGGGAPSVGVLQDVQAHQVQADARQNKGRSEAVFPNLSTQQFSTDASQFSRLSNDVAPTTQEFPPITGQQFVQGNQEIPVQSPNLRAPLSDGQLQQIPDGRQFPGQANSEALQPNQQQILRRIDGNELERTPQFIPVEAPKSRNNFRGRARTPSSSTTLQGPSGPEISTQSYDAQQGRSRSRQGAFRSRTRPYAVIDETTTTPTPPATPPSRSRVTNKPREEGENVPPRNVAFRGRLRSQPVETRPSLEAKERMFEEEFPETEVNDQANQTQLKNSSRSGKPFRGTVMAKLIETQSEDDVDSTENYPKEFLEKLKSSKGFVPPPKRSRQNSRTVAEPTFTPTAFNAGTARLKRKQFTTESYSRRDSDLSETTKRESETRAVTQSPENDKTTERSTTRQTRERYSQRFYRKLASKAAGGGAGTSAPTQTPTEPGKLDEASRSRTQVRKTFRSTSTAARPSTTTEAEVSTTEQPSSGEERRKFVPKKKISLEERKHRIAKLKEKLRQNATESELKAAESQESFVVKEALVVQANTHPGSREIYDIQEQKSAVQAKSSTSSNAKRARGSGARGEARPRDVEGTSNKYDLITLGSEENVQAVFLAKNASSTTTKKPKTKKTRTTPATTPSTTVRESGPDASATSTTSRPQAATQVPISTTSKPDFAVLNVTLFPSTRHRFSARINSSASIILPPDVELITTTAPSVALNAPETTTALERQPDFTFSVNKLFNSSLATTTSASVERATTDRNSFGTALFNPGTQSLSPGTTTQKSSTTTKRSSSKKKSSGRKKSKKSKSKTSGNGTTTKRPTARVNSTTASTATVRTAPVNSTGNASNSNSTGVRPLSLAFSDFEGVFNETMKVVNSNPMAGPLPGVVPRAELDALTPETILNGTGTEDATEGATARAETATSSNPNSVDNSTNQVESPGRLTSEVECTNGSCKNSKSQAVHFNDGANDARAPLPYARRGGTTKSPETLRRIFIYGIFPNNTVQRKPFPGDGDGQEFSARQYNQDRYYVDRYNADSYNANRYNPNRYNGDRYNADRYNEDQYRADPYSGRGRPTTSIPPYTPGDYYVFGVYPNNSVVRRRGWKTFDYEKYHSPYVIFGIYPNNTIIKKYPNGTTIDDEFMVSDNEITRKTIPNGNVYRGCSCANEAHHHVATPGVQTTEGTTPKTTTSPSSTSTSTTTTTTTTTEAPEESDDAEPEDSETEAPKEPDETETEEPERNAKDDAENIDFGSENISETDQPQTGISDENPTTTESGVPEDEEEEEGEDEEEEEQQSERTTESSLVESTTQRQEESTTTSPVSDVTETTTQTYRGSLSEAEEADTLTTTEAPEESTTRATESEGSEGLENAEEADDASTPTNLEETTNSLEREETQNAKGSGTLTDAEEADAKGSPEGSGAGSLAEAEEADNSRIAEEGTETSANDTTTERSENILEKEVESVDNVSETNEIAEDQTEESFPSTEKSENLQERTTAKGDEDAVTESNDITEENTRTNSEGGTTLRNAEEGTTERNSSEEGTIEENERLVESTTETNESLEDKNLSESTERERIQESTTQAGEYPNEYSTERRENLYETTTESYSSDGQDKSTEESENSTTQKGETTTETYFGDRDETERENVGDESTERSERILESTTELNSFRDRLESTEEPSTEENDNSRVQTTESNENSLENSTEEDTFSERPEYSDERTTEEGENSRETATENLVDRFGSGTINSREDLQESTTEGNLDYEDVTGSAEETTEDDNQFKFGSLGQSQQLLEGGTTESGEATETPASTPTPSPYSEIEDREAEVESSTENSVENDVSSSTEETSSEENFIIDLNSDVGSTTEDSRLETSTESSAEADAVDEDVGELSERGSAETEAPGRTTTGSPEENTVSEERFEGYSYERPTENPFDVDDLFGGGGDRSTTPPTEEPTEEATEAGAGRESSTTDYDIDVRELGNLISRLTTRAFVETTTTERPDANSATDDLLNALPPPGGEDIRTSASGALVKRRDRRAVDELDEPSSLTKLAYRALSSSETTSTPIPVLTTTTTTTTTMTSTTARASPSPPRAKSKKVKNLSKTSVTAYKNLTNLTSTPLPDEVFIVTPVSSTRGHSDADYFKRGKVKFVTLTPGVVVTTNVRDENDILTMSSQHVQKVTKAPAKIPDNFLSTVFGEIEEKASSPIPDILKNVQNDLQGDGLSASLARRIITLALEKAMTSTTPQVTPQAITATTVPVAVDSAGTTSIPQTTASYIQRITTAEPIIPTTTKKPVTTKKPNTTTKKPTTTTKKPKPKPVTTTTTTTTSTPSTTTTTTRKPFSSSTTRRPRTTSTTSTTTTTETPQTILITPKKSAVQQAIRNPTGAVTSPEFLGSTSGPEIVDGLPVIDVIPSGIDPLRVLFPDAKTTPPTTTISASQRVTEDLNVLLSGLWQEQTSAKSTPSETVSNLVEPKRKSSKSKSVLSKQASASLSESDLKILEAILQQQGAGGAAGDLEQIVQNQIRLAEEVRKASRNLKKKQRTTTTTTERAPPLGLGFLLNLFGAGSRPNGLFSNEQRTARRPRPVLASYVSLTNGTGVTPDPFNELDEGSTTGERSARGELVSAAIDVTKAVSKFMGTVLTSAAQSFQNFFRSLGR